MLQDSSRRNRFDLIRLLVSLSVVLFHSSPHLELDFPAAGTRGVCHDTTTRPSSQYGDLPLLRAVAGNRVSTQLYLMGLPAAAASAAAALLPGLA